ncbi:MAG TPA: hypothetical protein PLA97_22545 [Rubrivivax sp.]|nr:hypothetical protein [Rubrivivax sp.]
MAGFRLPGALCAVTNAIALDEGTLAVGATPAPGVVGVGKPGLDPNDPEIRRHLKAIESLKEGQYTVKTLKAMRAAHASLLIDAAFEFGEHSKAVQLQRLTLKTLDGLIATTSYLETLPARSDSANARLAQLLDRAEKGGAGCPSLDQIREAVTGAINLEHSRQLLGGGEGSTVMPLVMRALDVAVKHHQQELHELADKGLRNPDRVSDRQLQEAVATVLGDERQRQLLGGPPRDGEIQRSLRQAAQLQLRKRSLDLERAYDSGQESAIKEAERAYETAKRELEHYGGVVGQAEVKAGAPRIVR